ncbi:membrane protein, putative [uncultured Candidatus Thioglobus sp.]|nr:membrane protein, putative [uncultured Candidatus Thioglobus sp.]
MTSHSHIHRDVALDEMRGYGVLMMIVFHLIYDLNYFHFTQIALFQDTAYILWRWTIVAIFLNAVGITLVIKYRYADFKHFSKCLIKLAIVVVLLSLLTYLSVPKQWIYFGILHLILLSSLIAFFFVKYPNIAFIVAASILIAKFFNLPDLSILSLSLQGFLPSSTLDFYPLFPWLAMVLTGVYLAYHPWYKKIFFTQFGVLQFLGRNALVVYLTHQIFLFGGVYLAAQMMS